MQRRWRATRAGRDRRPSAQAGWDPRPPETETGRHRGQLTDW